MLRNSAALDFVAFNGATYGRNLQLNRPQNPKTPNISAPIQIARRPAALLSELTEGHRSSGSQISKRKEIRMATAFRKPEVWVIDSAVKRRGLVSNYLDSLGYLAYPMDPNDKLPSSYGRAVIAMVNDDDTVVNRVLDCRDDRPLSCVVYSDSLKAKRVTNLLRRGVTDLIDWPFEKQDFADAVSTAETNLSTIVEEGWRGATARERVETLSPREREVLVGILAGKTSREIAVELGLSPRTVEVHRLHCIRRLGVKNTAEAVKIAMSSGCFKHSIEL